MDQEKVFGEVLERKDAFLGYKNIDLKKPLNLHFSKGVSPWFFLKKKNGGFSIFCFNAKRIKKKCLVKFQRKKKPI